MKSPAYLLTRFIVRSAFWTLLFWGVWQVVTHLWWTGQGFTWSTNPFGN